MVLNRIDLMKAINQEIINADALGFAFNEKQAMKEVDLAIGIGRDQSFFGMMCKAVEVKMEEVEKPVIEEPAVDDLAMAAFFEEPVAVEETPAVKESVEVKTTKDSTVGPLITADNINDIMKVLLHRVKAGNIDRTYAMFMRFLAEKPTMYSGWMSIAKEIYGDKTPSAKLLKATISSKFVVSGLVEWDGVTKSPTVWK